MPNNGSFRRKHGCKNTANPVSQFGIYLARNNTAYIICFKSFFTKFHFISPRQHIFTIYIFSIFKTKILPVAAGFY